MGKLFGTDGIRGIANRGLTPELALRAGRAGAYVLLRENHHAPKVLVATDTRRSGKMLEAALTAGLCSMGAEVYLAGNVPTPAVAFLIGKYNFDAGVMITASHNPMDDNGIKFFNHVGQKLPDALEDEIEAIIAEMAVNDTLPRPEGIGVGIALPCPQAARDYTDFLLTTVPNVKLTSHIKIALDCANGATSHIAPQVFTSLGAYVYTLHNEPDGTNINDNCGSTHMESLAAYVKKTGAHIGLAFDGDGDRMLAIDDKGELLDGDAIMAICALYLQNRGQLSKNTLVGTVMSNQGLDVFCRKHGLSLFRTDVGDRYVLEKMLADDLTMGGEQSGHVIFRQFADTGDGILTGLQLFVAMVEAKQPLSEMRKMLEVFPQVLINARVSATRKNEFSTHPDIMAAQKEIEKKLGNEGRILVRPSGTEPLVRVMIEGRDQVQITAWAQELADIIKKELV